MKKITNATVRLYRRAQQKDGSVAETDLGQYEVWREEGSTIVVGRMPGGGEVIARELGRGTLFIWDDLGDVSGCVVEVGGERFQIVEARRFELPGRGFNHIEATYA